jgi:glutamine amidotransferase
MSRLFGIICNEPKRLHEAIEPVRETLVAPGPQQGWGLGYVHGNEVLLKRHPRPTQDVDFYGALESIASDYIIMHATAQGDYKGNDNTQPFRYKRWLFAQSGTLDGFEDIKPLLLEHIPTFMRRNIRGKTPAEHIFHTFLAFLHDAGVIADHNLPLAQSRRALRDTLAMVLGIITKTGGSQHLGNIVVTNSRTMLAVRLGEPMAVRRFAHKRKEAGEGHEFKAAFIASGIEEPGEGFEAVPDRSVIMVTRDLQISIEDLEA